MTDLFFATYDELILLTKAWKMHDALIKVVVNILIELASNSTQYIHGWQTCHWLPSRYVPDFKIRHVAMDLLRKPEQLLCYFLLHVVT